MAVEHAKGSLSDQLRKDRLFSSYCLEEEQKEFKQVKP